MQIFEIANPDDRLFFGKQLRSGTLLPEVIGEMRNPQAKIIIASVRQALQTGQHTHCEYLSAYTPGTAVWVSAHAEYRNDESVCLYLTVIGEQTACKDEKSDVEPGLDEETQIIPLIFNELPVGIAIYDKNGRLVETNAQGLRDMGIASKDDVLGASVFENPSFSDELKADLRAGKEMRFLLDYDFSKLGGHFKSSRNTVGYLEISVYVLRDRAGKINKYVVISKDISEHIELQQKYERLYNQNAAIIDSLPVGVGLYAANGTMIYGNDCYCQIFGLDGAMANSRQININDSPSAPEALKNAICHSQPIYIEFAYNFDAVNARGYYTTHHTKTAQLECKGKPILDAAGQVQSYVCIIDDVTDKTKRDEILRQSRQKTQMALQSAEIMLWEFDIRTKVFFSENEPMNGYDSAKPISIRQYTETVHPDNLAEAVALIDQMLRGVDEPLNADALVQFPDRDGWQYCTINGAPYERDAEGRVVKYVGTRKNNTELHRRKQLQDKILNSIPMSIHIKDVANDFRYIFCNEESKRLFGTSDEKTAHEVMDEQAAERIHKTDMEVYRTGEPYFGLERIVLKDGRVYDSIVRKSAVDDNGRRLLLNIRWDQGLQNDLERRAKLLSLTMETMNAYMWVYEPAINRINFGEGFSKIRKDAPEIDSLEEFAECIHPEDRQRFIDSLNGIINQESGEWFVEYRADKSDSGEYSWWETRGILETVILNDAPYKYVYGMTLCIEQHKRTELTLLKNKEDLNRLIRQNELILNNTNSGLAYITTDYVVQWKNISGCSSSLLLEAYKQGECCYETAHNRTSPCENCVMQRALVSRQMEQVQFALEDDRVIEVMATPVFNGDGTIDGIVIRVDDITERQKMIQELQQAKGLAEQSDKLKSAFLANMSHEIRTPLNAIVGFSELLMTSEEGEERDEYVKIISNNNELLLKLINDILDLSKLEAGSVELKYEEFDLSEYFNGVSASMRQRVTNPNVRLIASNPYQICRVNLDKNRVAQLMTNFVTNAIKYTPKGFIEMGYEAAGTGIRMYVKDSGIGIPEEKKKRVFHRFAKLDEFAQGTGLGLSICKAIAESMGGRVGFESEHNEGSLFWVELPCKPIVEARETAVGSGVENPPSESEESASDLSVKADSRSQPEFNPNLPYGTILIAEDIPSNYLLLSAMLQKYFRLLHAQDGVQAVKMAQDNQVDLLLMDMKMPVMDGLTATAEIRKFDRKLPIVALTAHAFESDRIAALEAGCTEYLVKPIDKPRLMSVLRKYIKGTKL